MWAFRGIRRVLLRLEVTFLKVVDFTEVRRRIRFLPMLQPRSREVGKMKFIVLLHVLAGATLFGGQFYVESLMAAAARAKDPTTLMTVGGKVGPTSLRLFVPAGFIALLTGVWIVIDSAYDFESMFVVVGFLLVIVALAIALFLLKPGQDVLRDLIAEHGMTSSEAMEKAKALGNLSHVQTLLVSIIMIVMVLKPGL